MGVFFMSVCYFKGSTKQKCWVYSFVNFYFLSFFFGEIRNLTTFTRLMDCNNGFSVSFFFLSFLSFLWIGAQFPQEKFLSYERIFTLQFYFLLMCILFTKKSYILAHLFKICSLVPPM